MEMEEFGKRERSEVWKWFWLFVAFALIATFIGFVVRPFGMFAERKAFEQSYQKVAGDRHQIAVWQGQIAAAQAQLGNPDISEGERADIRAQIATLQVQLQAAEATR